VTGSADGALVLIVEDDARNAKLFRDLLAYHGFRTVEATSAEEGLALAEEELPDLVLMDIRLPGMDGVSALGQLRANRRTAEIPVLAATASVMKEDLERFDEAGFDGYVVKPIDTAAFPDQVRHALNARRAAS
jgi:two-component system, cell cycle response regulator DivK